MEFSRSIRRAACDLSCSHLCHGSIQRSRSSNFPYRDFMLSPRVPWSRFLIVSNGFLDVARDTEKDGAVHRRRSSSAPPSVRCCLARILVRTTPAVHSPAPLPVSTGDPVAQELQPWHDEFRTEPPATEDTLREMQLRNISLNERIAWTASTTFAVQFFLRISSQPKNTAPHVTWQTFMAVCCAQTVMLAMTAQPPQNGYRTACSTTF